MGRDTVSKRTSFSRVFWLRALVVVTLMGVAALIGYVSYNVLREEEMSLADSVYDSVSAAALDNTQTAFHRATRGATMLSALYSAANPLESDWPNAAMEGFAETTAQLAELSSVALFSVSPVVRPAQVAQWEAFAFALWDADPQIPANRAYVSPTDRGVWNFDPSAERSVYLDNLSGNTSWGNTLRIVMPVTQGENSDVLGLSAFGDPAIGPLVERSLLCATGKDVAAARTGCNAVLTPLSLPLPNPLDPNPSITTGYQTVIVSPIPIGGGSSRAVGAVMASLDWTALLAHSVHSFNDEMDIVVEAEGAMGGGPVLFTYVFRNGAPTFKGDGDLHDTRYSDKRNSGQLYQPSLIGIAESSHYKISFYPRKAFYDKYQSNNPIYFSVGGVSLIALVSLIFLLYDFAVSSQSEKQQVVLDTKRRYVRFISHEIRTPLNTVRLGLKLFDVELVATLKMLGEHSPAEAVRLVREVIENWIQLTDDTLSNTEAAVDVLNDLLNYDKIESGTLRLEFSSVPIWQVLKKTSAGFAMQAREKKVTLLLTGAIWDASAQELTQYQALQVVGDSMRISQVLRNLMSNALKFTPTLGCVSVHAEWLPAALADAQIDMTPEEAQQWQHPRAGAVRVSVTDTGVGLSPAQLLEIGAEGVQFNANQLQAGQGSGLGLFISKGIAQQHGGSFAVTSEGLDCGATFTILLPLFLIPPLPEDPSRSRPPSFKGAVGAVSGGRQEGPRLLVVDDALSNRKMLLRILRAKEYVCEEAENGQQALEKYEAAVARGEPFDAILSDYEMPVMNGPDSVWAMRCLGCKCFIAGITGNVMPEDMLAKPLNTDVFESLFRNFKPRDSPYGSQKGIGGGSPRGGGSRVRPAITAITALPTSPTPPSPSLPALPMHSALPEMIGSVRTLFGGGGAGAGGAGGSGGAGGGGASTGGDTGMSMSMSMGMSMGMGMGVGMQAGRSFTEKLTGITLSERERVHPHPLQPLHPLPVDPHPQPLGSFEDV